jgi:hypothetical protein
MFQLAGSQAYTCNPSYSGGRDQEYHGSRPVQKIESETVFKKKKEPQHIKGLVQSGPSGRASG